MLAPSPSPPTAHLRPARRPQAFFLFSAALCRDASGARCPNPLSRPCLGRLLPCDRLDCHERPAPTCLRLLFTPLASRERRGSRQSTQPRSPPTRAASSSFLLSPLLPPFPPAFVPDPPGSCATTTRLPNARSSCPLSATQLTCLFSSVKGLHRAHCTASTMILTRADQQQDFPRPPLRAGRALR